MVLHETLMLVTLGVVAGIGLVLAFGRLAETQLYGLSPRDPLTLSITSLAVIAVGLISGALPAWRASNVSPTIALRQDA
jgi:ABC-type antimicrobial peptide transport system permease subunit